MEESGRWSLVRQPVAAADHRFDAGAIEHIARALLRRYGVMFWRMLERESSGLPPWRELLRVYRRLESSGEIRGGRFVAGFTGEQFALPEAIGALREIRRQPTKNEWTAVSGVDPLNLAGILTPGPRLAALAGNRLLYRDGVPVATLFGGEVRFVEPLDPATEWFARKALVRATRRAPFSGAECYNAPHAEKDLESASS
jgi:ATP-dependent Lhr-like helicase